MDLLEILGLILMVGAIVGAVVAARGSRSDAAATSRSGVTAYVPYLVAFIVGALLYMLG